MRDAGGSVGFLLLVVLAGCRDRGGGRPTAAFSATPVSGVAPLVVQFTDQSRGAIGGWDWRFGDGESLPSVVSSSPSHTYTEPGTYTVSLHVISCSSAVDCVHDWEEKTDLITVAAPAVAGSPPAEQAPPAHPTKRPSALTASVPVPVDPPRVRDVGPHPCPAGLELVVRRLAGEAEPLSWLDGLEPWLEAGARRVPFLLEPRGEAGVRDEWRYVLARFEPWALLEPRPRLHFVVEPGAEATPARGRALERAGILATYELRLRGEGYLRTVLRGALAPPVHRGP